jgi:putative transposase
MSIEIVEGAKVYYLDNHYEIKKVLDFDSVLAVKLETGTFETLPIAHLSSHPLSQKPKPSYDDLSEVPKQLLDKANARYEAIKPLFGLKSRRAVEERAKELSVSVGSLYNWLKVYESTGRLSSLIFEGTTGGKGKSRINKETEAIIDNEIQNFYLSPQKPTAVKVHEAICLKCKKAGIDRPAISTVRRRIGEINEQLLLKKREGKSAAFKFTPIQGEYPDGNFPLEVIQIDHTMVDIMLVDTEHRLRLGRPWITLAIDIFSRMIAGFYVSLDSPGYFGTGQCIANAILSKEQILHRYKLKSKWPVSGFPTMLHMDNAREFRGNNIEMVCKEYGMTVVWRPVSRPNFGGHIERLVRTLNEDIHTLQGTTFSNTGQRGKYDSEGNAIMTLDEFEEWIAVLIVDKYHNSIHSELGKTPLKRYEEGIFGSDEMPPRGRIVRVEKEDTDRIRINLLPAEERTIQRYGIVIDGITYYSEVLNYFIGMKKGRESKTFLIRRDPRDTGHVYFYDPEKKQYYTIPIRDRRKPSGISIWEYRAAKRHLEAQNKKDYNEDDVFDAIDRMKQIEEESKRKTLVARKNSERAIKLKTSPIPVPEILNASRKTNDEIDDFDEDLFKNLKPFDGIVESSGK